MSAEKETCMFKDGMKLANAPVSKWVKLEHVVEWEK